VPAERGQAPRGRGRGRRSRRGEAAEERPGGKRGRGGRAREREPKPTKKERAAQRRRDAEADEIQREARGEDATPRRRPSLDEVLSEREPAPEGQGGSLEDLRVAQAAGSEFERPLVREFAARQPSTARTYGSALGNWRSLRARYPRIAQLFSGGSRPDSVSVDPAARRITLFDPTSRPGALHQEGTIEYMQRLLDDPVMKQLFDGWQVVAEERYWEAGFRNLRPRRVGRITGSGGR
jgi:hypothetical protein